MLRAGVAGAALLLLAGCATAPDAGPRPAPSASASASASAAATAAATATASATASAGASPTATAVPGADELGRVPVLMYHQIIPRPGADDLTPDQFRAQIDQLYADGYRPVTAADLVAGRIDVPAGRHPVVLSFDDSTISQAQIGADGEPTPDSALGVLEAFGRAHADFRPTATFFVNTRPEPFADDKVLPWLAAHGYEIGAHTRSHPRLRRLSDAAVQEEIGGNVADIEAAVPGYRVSTFATTGGVWPANRELARRGEYAGTAYAFAGVFGVDEISAPSPYAAAFNPYQVPRVGTVDAAATLETLRAHPATRFTSDGDPDTVSFPAARADGLAAAWRGRARPY